MYQHRNKKCKISSKVEGKQVRTHLQDVGGRLSKTQEQALHICKAVKTHSVNTAEILREVPPSVIIHTEEAGTSSHASHSRTVNDTGSDTSLPLTINTNIKDKLRTLDRNFSSVQIQFMKAPGVTLADLQSCLSTLASFQSNAPTPLWEANRILSQIERLLQCSRSRYFGRLD